MGIAGVVWCKCSVGEVGFWAGSASTEMVGHDGPKKVGQDHRNIHLGQSLFLKITIMGFEAGPLWV